MMAQNEIGFGSESLSKYYMDIINNMTEASIFQERYQRLYKNFSNMRENEVAGHTACPISLAWHAVYTTVPHRQVT